MAAEKKRSDESPLTRPGVFPTRAKYELQTSTRCLTDGQTCTCALRGICTARHQNNKECESNSTSPRHETVHLDKLSQIKHEDYSLQPPEWRSVCSLSVSSTETLQFLQISSHQRVFVERLSDKGTNVKLYNERLFLLNLNVQCVQAFGPRGPVVTDLCWIRKLLCFSLYQRRKR